jgi:hypothetical protein
MTRSIPCAWLLISCPALAASQWTDPGFEEMVESSEMIVVAEVVEGGKLECTVRSLDVIKGARPEGTFRVAGYNNEGWPPEGIEKESLAGGEKLLLFLRQDKPGTWFVPTPTTGDYRIRDGKLHGGWYETSYPHVRPGVDAGLALELVRGLVLQKSALEPAKARELLAGRLTEELAGRISADDEGEENMERIQLAEWLLCAQAAFGEKGLERPILAAARCAHPHVKLCAARAVGTIGPTPEARDALGKLLLVPDSLVQAESARSLIRCGFKREEAAPLLLEALPGSSGEEGAPRGIMDPLLNTSASGRELMVRAITRLEVKDQAHDTLVALIRDEGLSGGVFEALADHFLRFRSARAHEKFLELHSRAPVDSLPYFHRYLVREKSRTALEAVNKRLLENELGALGVSDALEELLPLLPGEETLLEPGIVGALERFRGQESESYLFIHCLPAATEDIARLLEGRGTEKLEPDALRKLEIAREAVRLKLSPTVAPRERVEKWTQLIRRQYDHNGGEYPLVKELIRSTPPDLRSQAVEGLRSAFKKEEDLSAPVLKAIRDLGGKLTQEEKAVVDEFVACEN